MRIMKGNVRIVLAAALFAAPLLGVQPAHARRSLAIGSPVTFQGCFAYSHFQPNAGLQFITGAPNCGPNFVPPLYIVPAQLDTSGSKTVALTVKQTAANQISCGLLEFNATGSVLQSIMYNPFPSSGYSTQSKSITIASGNNLGVVCQWNLSATDPGGARMHSISY
jgi:hypothetical protein